MARALPLSTEVVREGYDHWPAEDGSASGCSYMGVPAVYEGFGSGGSNRVGERFRSRSEVSRVLTGVKAARDREWDNGADGCGGSGRRRRSQGYSGRVGRRWTCVSSRYVDGLFVCAQTVNIHA